MLPPKDLKNLKSGLYYLHGYQSLVTTYFYSWDFKDKFFLIFSFSNRWKNQ